MNILAIETTGPKSSVALLMENGEIFQENRGKELSHLQSLIPMIDDLLEKCQLSIDDITHIAVSQGPGSFTGIRIGMATGKALAQALNLPCISVPTLRSFIWNKPGFKGLVCPIFDARREEVYGGAYYLSGDQGFQAISDNAGPLSDFLQAVADYLQDKDMEVLFFGDGVNPYENQLKQWAVATNRISLNDDLSRIVARPEDLFQKASSVAREALKIALAGGEKEFDKMNPVYLRKAEAERRLEENCNKDSLGGPK